MGFIKREGYISELQQRQGIGITCSLNEASFKTGYFRILIYFLFLMSKYLVDSG